MSATDDAMKANERYYQTFTGGMLEVRPRKQLAVVACMDSRMDIFAMLGIEPGDAHVIRNAGGIITDDMIRSLLISHHLLGIREIMIINHTDCGLQQVREEELRRELVQTFGKIAVAPECFHTFQDVEENVRIQILKARSHPWIKPDVSIRGFVYDVRTGRLEEVTVR
jgi:carbonic anhydrase